MSQPIVNPPLPERRPINIPSILTRAAAVIERNGLWQGGFVEPGPAGTSVPQELAYRRVCTAGAIRIATSGNPEEDCPAARAAVRYMSGLIPGSAPVTDGEADYLEHVAYWNDRPGRTTGEVAAVLRELAVLAAGVVTAA
jgi:hypothetical protein